MGSPILLYIGSVIIALWGIAHIFPTRSIVAGFGELSSDNRNIITMEWIAEGLALSFLGVIALVFALRFGIDNPAAILVYRFSAAMLIVLAVLSSFTGARTSILPMKLCPVIKTLAALLLVLGSI